MDVPIVERQNTIDLFRLYGDNSFWDGKLEAAIHTRMISKSTVLVPNPAAERYQPRAYVSKTNFGGTQDYQANKKKQSLRLSNKLTKEIGLTILREDSN